MQVLRGFESHSLRISTSHDSESKWTAQYVVTKIDEVDSWDEKHRFEEASPLGGNPTLSAPNQASTNLQTKGK